ncbi:disulfide isomerase [Parathielavia hyrcaniae]|uniref:protein disulfide-isomerase n=1 Tax=Parathielavia hyrcaniae TaxID=113614 RepID=A0AAN6Q822_9PEZI|nr:disulfide isomerase [Parathielavia hyrcaniae]
MVLIKSFVLAGLAAAAAAKSAVLDLIPSNFDKVVLKSGKPTLVEFFAPWCGHCKTLAPVYEELALAFEHAKDKVQIAKVNADAERDLGKRFGVQGFPTLKFFDGKSDKPTDYNGGRDLEALSNFITEKTGAKPRKKAVKPSSVLMLTDSTFKQQIGGDKNVLVAFTAPWCGHCKTLAPTWEALAETFASEENVVVAKVDADASTGKATAAEYGVSGYPTIKFFPAGSTTPEAYNGGRSEEALVTFLNEKAGTHRAPGGGVDATAGTVESLDTVVAKLMGGTALVEAAAEAQKAAESLTDKAQAKFAEYYLRVFDKLSKSEDYSAKELGRLEGIIKKGGLAPTKLDELTSKTNVLRKFIQKATGGEEEKEEL